jgi:hypothetical protein
MTVTKEALTGAQAMIDAIVKEKHCGPIFVRLAWHDSGTFDKSIEGTQPWPAAGGAIGSIRFEPEILHGANKGLSIALGLLQPVKDAFPDVSYADLFQMASARGIALAGGPDIPMTYGRVDATGPELCSPEGNLPDGNPGPAGKYGGPGGTASTECTTPEGHLRKVFHRMGLTDEDIVALSGAHTFGEYNSLSFSQTASTAHTALILSAKVELTRTDQEPVPNRPNTRTGRPPKLSPTGRIRPHTSLVDRRGRPISWSLTTRTTRSPRKRWRLLRMRIFCPCRPTRSSSWIHSSSHLRRSLRHRKRSSLRPTRRPTRNSRNLGRNSNLSKESLSRIKFGSVDCIGLTLYQP